MGHAKPGFLGAVTFFPALMLLNMAHSRADEFPPQAFDIRPQNLAAALSEFARQSRQEILFAPELVAKKNSDGVRGTMPPLAALTILLKDTGLPFSNTPNGAILIAAAPAVRMRPHHAPRRRISRHRRKGGRFRQVSLGSSG